MEELTLGRSEDTDLSYLFTQKLFIKSLLYAGHKRYKPDF